MRTYAAYFRDAIKSKVRSHRAIDRNGSKKLAVAIDGFL